MKTAAKTKPFLRILTAAAIGLLLLTDRLVAQTSWTGAVDTNWSNNGNWTANAPTVATTAFFNAGAPTNSSYGGGDIDFASTTSLDHIVSANLAYSF